MSVESWEEPQSVSRKQNEAEILTYIEACTEQMTAEMLFKNLSSNQIGTVCGKVYRGPFLFVCLIFGLGFFFYISDSDVYYNNSLILISQRSL